MRGNYYKEDILNYFNDQKKNQGKNVIGKETIFQSKI
jgi:hypothetical protein